MNMNEQDQSTQQKGWNFDWEKNTDQSDTKPLSMDELEEVIAEIRC